MTKDVNPGKNTAADWISARLREMDAAIEAIEKQRGEVEAQVRDQAESNLATLQETRVQMEKASQKALEQSASAFPSFKEEMAPVWDGFQAALQKWSEVAGLHEDVLSAQVKAQSQIWGTLFDGYRKELSSADDDFRANWFQRFEDVSQQMTRLHARAAATTDSPWNAINDAMEKAREAAEKAAEDFQTAVAGTNKN